MNESFAQILAVGGKSNSLGRTSDVIDQVLQHKDQLDELYSCVFNEDAWIRMRAIDALEKICRQYPDWLLPYIDKFQAELDSNTQPSIQWHLAQIYSQVTLSTGQKQIAIRWLKQLISHTDVDWIVAANGMQTLVQFTNDGSVSRSEMVLLLKVQQHHASKSVVKKAGKLLAGLTA